MNVWRLMTHHDKPAEALKWCRTNGRVAIGWSGVKNIVKEGYRSPKEITAAIKTWWPGSRNAGQGGVNLWDFCHSIQRGDLVILSAGGRRAQVMEITGDYEYAQTPQEAFEGYTHQRAARVLPIDPDRLWAVAGRGPCVEHNKRWALLRCSEPINQAVKASLIAATP